MSKILKSLKLIQDFEIELETRKKSFVQRLKDNVDEEEIKFSTSVLDVFSQGTYKYKGKVGFKGFTLKKRSRLFDLGKNISVIRGSYVEKGKTLNVPFEVNGFKGGMKLYYFLLTLFYLFYLFGLGANLISGQTDDASMLILLTLLQMVFFFGMPYFIMRRSIRYLKSEILRDFTSLSK